MDSARLFELAGGTLVTSEPRSHFNMPMLLRTISRSFILKIRQGTLLIECHRHSGPKPQQHFHVSSPSCLVDNSMLCVVQYIEIGLSLEKQLAHRNGACSCCPNCRVTSDI